MGCHLKVCSYRLRSRVVTAQRKAKGQARAAPKAAAARKKRAESDQIRVGPVHTAVLLYSDVHLHLPGWSFRFWLCAHTITGCCPAAPQLSEPECQRPRLTPGVGAAYQKLDQLRCSCCLDGSQHAQHDPDSYLQTKVTEVQERLDLYVGLYENLARCNGLGAHLRKFGVPHTPLNPALGPAAFSGQLGLQEWAMHGTMPGQPDL